MGKSKNWTIKERLVAIEVKLDNHLQHHDRMVRYLYLPILAGMALILLKLFILD
jgi:hypothetical protein